MTSGLGKLILTAHITFSVAWIGAAAAFIALAIAALISQDPQKVRAAFAAMELTARFVIVPVAFASLLSGLIQSLGTPWGLFRHYWVLTKFFLTVFATVVLLKKMPLIGSAARRAADTALFNTDLHSAAMPLVVHAAGGILVLLVITILSVYKPWGLTHYGRRKQQERQYQLTTSVQTGRVTAISDPDDQISGRGLSRGLRIAIAAGIGVFFIVAHLAVHVTGHGFHHGH